MTPHGPLITPAQCRAGRAMLRWSIAELAHQARVSSKTINRFETEEREISPRSLFQMVRALEDAGVEFRPDGSVRLVPRH